MTKKIDNVNQKAPAGGDVLELVHGLMHDYRSSQYRFLRDSAHDITHMDFRVLGFFARHPGSTQSDLAEHSGRDKAQLARLIKGLREKKLLDAEVDAVDRRQVRLSLSTDGHSVQRALQQQTRRLEALAVHGLTPDERQVLTELLARVRANVRNE